MQLPVTIDPRYHDAVIFGLEGAGHDVGSFFWSARLTVVNLLPLAAPETIPVAPVFETKVPSR